MIDRKKLYNGYILNQCKINSRLISDLKIRIKIKNFNRCTPLVERERNFLFILMEEMFYIHKFAD